MVLEMFNMLRLVLMSVFLCAICGAQKPKFMIVTDMEGVGGVNNADEQLLPGQRRYDESRQLLVGELNAAIKGLLEAGAGQVVVWDGHDGSRSLSIADINPAAELIQLREVVRFLDTALLNAPLPHTILAATSNAIPVKVRKRDIPRPLTALGASVVYQVTDDSLAPLGVLDGDLVYLRPLSEVREAVGRLAVCNLRGEA